jgi:hypothetical protein
MFKIFYTILIVFVGLTSCQAVPSLVEDIAQENRVEYAMIGFSGSSSSIYEKFEKIKSKATKEELVVLLDHDSVAVVCYALYALMDKELVEPSVLFERSINNDKKVSTYYGCIMMSETLSALIYNRYWESRIEYLDDYYENYKIHDTFELQKMDSLILHMEIPNEILVRRTLENRPQK